MLKYVDYDIVFSEIPDETTLAINISNCPHRCPGCHSPHLMEDTGETLNIQSLGMLLERYSPGITCVCFMGGDCLPHEVERLSFIAKDLIPGIKTAWYSGFGELPHSVDILSFDYLKLGPFIESLGGLKSPETNQRLYKIHPDGWREDITICLRGNNSRNI